MFEFMYFNHCWEAEPGDSHAGSDFLRLRTTPRVMDILHEHYDLYKHEVSGALDACHDSTTNKFAVSNCDSIVPPAELPKFACSLHELP